MFITYMYLYISNSIFNLIKFMLKIINEIYQKLKFGGIGKHG